MHDHSIVLLDEYGQPLSTRLQGALLPLAPRLQRQFPALNDACTLTEVLEEAGQRMAAREERLGPLDNLDAYAWVVARRVAALRLRCDAWAIASATLTGPASEVALRDMPSGFATSEQIYNEILYRELVTALAPADRRIAQGKVAGHSDDEIARGCGTSSRTVFNAWRRLKRKIVSQAQGVCGRQRGLAWKRSSNC